MPLAHLRPSPTQAAALAVVLSSALYPLAVSAEESVELSNLVVTATGYAQEISSAPASISIIDREQLESGAYSDLTDALRNVPGVVVTGGGAGDNGTDISLRGMPAGYTLLLVDGKPVASRETRPNGSAGFEGDWLPPVQAIERIEVVRGPMSTLYGSDAMGGVINIITRKVQKTWHGNLKQELTLQEDQDFGNAFQTSFNLSGPLVEDKVGLQVYGRLYKREEDQVLYGQEEKDLQNLTARLSLTPTEQHDFTLEAGITDERRISLMGASAPATDCGRSGCSDSDNRFNHKTFALSHTGRWNFGTTDSFVQRESAENDTRQIEIVNTRAKTSLVTPLGDNHLLTLGASYEEESLQDRTTNTLSDRTDVDNSQWALFTEDEWALSDDLLLTAGARLDKNDNYGEHISPRLYGVYSLAPNWTLKGGIAGGFRSPSLREVTPDWGQVSRGGNIYGNPDLKPETSLSKEIALYYNNNAGLDASATLFHNDFKDKITRIVCPETICADGPNDYGNSPTYRVNVDEAFTRGIELSLSQALTPRLDLSASYTYTDSEQKTGQYKGEPLTQLPKHLLSTNLNWQASERLSQWTRVTYRGKESNPTTGPSSDTTVAPSSTQFDSGLSYQLNASATVQAGVYNLLDESVLYDEYGYVADGRRYWLALNLSF